MGLGGDGPCSPRSLWVLQLKSGPEQKIGSLGHLPRGKLRSLIIAPGTVPPASPRTEDALARSALHSQVLTWLGTLKVEIEIDSPYSLHVQEARIFVKC